MLTHPTLERLIALGLTGMAKAFDDQRRQPDVAALPFEDRLALMVDREVVERQNKCLATRLKFAGLRHMAVVEDIDLATPRGLDRTLFTSLVAGDWIERKLNLLIIGPTGVGKSWIACALGHKACRDDRSVLYHRLPRLLEALALARGDGRYGRLLARVARVELLILDDWGLAPLTAEQRRDLLEIVDDRHGRALHHRHQPGSGRTLARRHRRSDAGRRHPRPPRPQRPPPRPERRKHAKDHRPTRQT